MKTDIYHLSKHYPKALYKLWSIVYVVLATVAILANIFFGGLLIFYFFTVITIFSYKILSLFLTLIFLSNMCSKLLADIISHNDQNDLL